MKHNTDMPINIPNKVAKLKLMKSTKVQNLRCINSEEFPSGKVPPIAPTKINNYNYTRVFVRMRTKFEHASLYTKIGRNTKTNFSTY